MYRVALFSLLLLTVACGTEEDTPVEIEGQKLSCQAPCWEADSYTLTLAPSEDVISTGEAILALMSAATTWNQVGVGPTILVSDTLWEEDPELGDDPLNLVFFEEEEWLATPGVVGFALRYNENLEEPVQHVDIALNAVHHEFSTTGEPGKFDLESLMVHEIGHTLGLEHIEGDSEATMYPAVPAGRIDQRTLSQADINLLLEKYGD